MLLLGSFKHPYCYLSLINLLPSIWCSLLPSQLKFYPCQVLLHSTCVLFSRTQSSHLPEWVLSTFHIFFTHLSTEGRLGCFLVLPVINGMTTWLNKYHYSRILSPLGVFRGVIVPHHTVEPTLNFLSVFHTDIHGDCTGFQLHQG